MCANSFSRKLSTLLFLFSLLGLTALPQTKPAVTPQTKQTTPVNRSDAEINAILKTKLARSKIGADGFKFSVQGGIVYIDGKTDIPQHKGAATRMARTSGAKAVVNRIVVGDAGKEKATAHLKKGPTAAQ